MREGRRVDDGSVTKNRAPNTNRKDSNKNCSFPAKNLFIKGRVRVKTR
jgi:hypothetical protein